MMTILRLHRFLPAAAVLSSLALLPVPPPAQGQEAAPKPSRRPTVPVESLKRGAQWENRGTAYAVVPEVRALMAANKDETPAAALTREGVTTGTVMERKGGFVLYKDAAAPVPLAGSTAPAPLVAAKGDPRPVVLNLRTGKLAVALNSIRAELKDATAAEAIASGAGVTLGKQFPNRPVVYFTVPAGMDLITLVAKLRADPRVAQADLELVEYVRTPH